MRRFNPEKELYKIQHGNRNKIILFVISLLVVGIIGYSFALYQVRYSKRIIYTKVAPFSNKDIELAIYLDDSPSSTNDFPEKNSGYKYDHIECDNKSTGKFDSVKWKVILEAGTKDKCDVYFVKEEGMPNVPEMYQGLIPIVYDDNGNISVADTTTDWYNYDEKRWANAVLVDSSNYNKYIKNGEYISNKTIPMNEILQMYVWIPRYKYQLFNAVNGESKEEQEIKIEFESGNQSTGEVSCEINDKGVEACRNDSNGNWFTHPAFTFGDTDLTGIWYGKFESSGSDTNVMIIPNASPLLNANVNYMFNASRNIEETYATKYNINKDEIDTHMMKNMEWGAIAYITHSKYGRCDSSGKCVEVSRNEVAKTGYSNSSSPWNTTNGMASSTTGNMYGLYDTNGSAWEHVMGNMVDKTGNFLPSASGFTVAPNKKYYDIYEYDANSYVTQQRGHLGDATREMMKTFGNENGGWYDDLSRLPIEAQPWIRRGGTVGNGIHSGSFTYEWDYGDGRTGDCSFRTTLTAQDGVDPNNQS